jgi:hypothetical protein
VLLRFGRVEGEVNMRWFPFSSADNPNDSTTGENVSGEDIRWSKHIHKKLGQWARSDNWHRKADEKDRNEDGDEPGGMLGSIWRGILG